MKQPQADPHNNTPLVSISGTQVMFAVIVMVILMLAINFGGRVSADRELGNVQDVVTAEIESLRQEQADLIRRLSYVEGDAYVEEWARSDGRMVRDGDVLIVPIPSTSSLLQAEETPQTVFFTPTEPQTTAIWQLWWALFFDTPPPQF